jgi:hypothetical protein
MSANRLVPVVIALALGAAACSGGPKVSTSTSNSSPAAPPGAAASPGSGFRRGGLAGTVSSFDGATLVLATRQGATVDVQTSGSTAVTRPVTGTVSDLVPDATVVVSGPLNADGTYAASTIVIGAPGAGGTLGGAAGGNRNGTPAPRQGAGSFGGARAGTAGTVKAVNGAAVVLTTAQGSTVTIVTSPSTAVTKTVAGTLSDLTPGEAVTVTGSQNADGTYTATRIVIGGAVFGGFSGGGGGGGGSGAATSPNTNNSPSSPGPTGSASPVTGA